jgi:hypothetical protein
MLYKSGQLKSLKEVEDFKIKNSRNTSSSEHFGCIPTLPCEKCFALITDSICLCAGCFVCPECKHQNGAPFVLSKEKPTNKYAYAIKHKRTGLYYCSTRVRNKYINNRRISTTINIREKMTLYMTKPNLKHYTGYSNEEGFRVRSGLDDFEIETFLLIKQENETNR